MQAQVVRSLLSLSIALWWSTLTAAQESWNLPPFSATQVLESRKGSMSMKVHLSGSSVRIERSDALSTLYVPSSGKVYNFTTYPDQSHQCVVMTPAQAKMLPSPLELLQGSNLKRISVGTDVLDGHPCKVETISATRPDGSKIESKVWEAQDLQGIPIRIESHVGDVTLSAVYRDILVGGNDQGLFTIPDKCTPFDGMGQVAEQKTVR